MGEPSESVFWRIEDFKSIKQAELCLDGGAVNLLAGMNSSGKSSLIQSLLLAAQNLKSQGNLVLNGPLVRLGTAKETIREGQETIKLSVGFLFGEKKFWAKYELEGDPEAADEIRVKSLRISRVSDERDSGEEETHIVELSSKPSKSFKQDRQEIHGGSVFEHSVILRIKRFGSGEQIDPRSYVEFVGLIPVAMHKFPKPQESQKDLAIRLQKFLAGELGQAGDRKSGLRTRSLEFLLWMQLNEMSDDEMEEYGLEPPLVSALMEGWKKQGFGPSIGKKALKNISYAVADRLKVDSYVIELRGHLSRKGRGWGMSRDAKVSVVWELQHQQTVDILKRVAEVVTKISSSINYLGPLRDEPRVLWANFSGDKAGLPVGMKGEYTAQLLRESHRKIAFNTASGNLVEEPLLAAVNHWLGALNLANGVKAESEGGLGVSMQVEVSSAERNLTSVGVGVSQALPVIIAVLTAPPRSVIMLEQPELHLHPATQSRLADFLMRARTDLTIIVETHSEALVTRIRRRKAEGEDIADRVYIYFVEKIDGCSNFEKLTLTKTGDLEWWPKGFLDDGSDLRALVEAKLRRKGVFNERA